MWRLSEVLGDTDEEPLWREHCPKACHNVSKRLDFDFDVDYGLSLPYLKKHLTTCFRSLTVCWSTS
jgi:hypothetical protein